MEFHISRVVRESTQIDDLLFSYSGNVVFADVGASRRLAEALNKERGPNADPAGTFNAGALFAMGLIDELSHALVAQFRRQIDPAVLTEAVRWFEVQVDVDKSDVGKLDKLLLTFTEQFPNVAVFRGQITAADWLRGSTDGQPNREAAMEELLMLWLANANPAFKPFHLLFEDKGLREHTVYARVVASFPDYFKTRPKMAPEIGSLFDALRAPQLASPDSLTGQLDFIRERWAPYLGDDIKRILLAIDVLREEDIAIWMRFHPPGPDQFRHGAPIWGSQGFEGDEFVGYDELKRKKYAFGYQAPLDEYEAFSADQAWMPNVVLMAKSTYVWLEQLSKKYQRHIHRLDQIPDEELQLLASRGITGLWLIGLWERSVASQTIKRLRGHYDAVASAYSLKNYDIAEDLGGWLSYDNLKHRAAHFGLRLASDMVPNHMGIDSPWVVEHPDWFLHRWESPFPAYSFNGPDLSSDSRVEIKIDDRYYDQSDAAVAFRLRNYSSGETRYVYHGNDGTSFAWNDTAQLDYSKAAVREHVIQTILHVARLFPIIRFDAAMVLAKRHVQRLWFPLPGAGGSIPSRAENAISQEEFDALMPNEFWREVVDRVAAEVPGTLLLAEAFWLLEGYFVRTLGMHRVYNSAFMNMMRDEENAKYRSYLKKTIEFDPDIMKRYVNFMSNPDERTAIDQFGSGDKYFGVSTLLATLPGLPMFAHGQIEGFTERYGMEFKQARMDEWPDDGLVIRHQREIAPLLAKRYIFAGSSEFTLYDFWNGYGHVDENVFAYSNRYGEERSLILYNNRYESTRGTIHISAAFMDKGSGNLRQRSLSDGLALPTGGNVVLAYRDSNGLEYLRRATEIHWRGMSFELRGFQCVVLLDWRVMEPNAEWPWDRLCDVLNGAGVHSIHDEIAKLRLRPLHEALGGVVSQFNVVELAAIADELAQQLAVEGTLAAAQNSEVDPRLRLLIDKSQIFFDRLLEFIPEENRAPKLNLPISSTATRISRRPASEPTYVEGFGALLSAAVRLQALAQSFSTDWPAQSRPILPGNAPATRQERTWVPILAWIVLRCIPAECAPDGDRVELFDRLLLRHALADIFAPMGMAGESAWQAAAQVRALLSPTALAPDVIHSEALWADPDLRWLAGVNQAAGVTYFNKQQFEELLTWLQLPVLLEIARTESIQPGERHSIGIRAIEDVVASARKAAQLAGYDLKRFLLAYAPAEVIVASAEKIAP